VCAAFVLAVTGALVWHGATSALGSELRRTAIVKAVERARPSIVNIRGCKTLSTEGGGDVGEPGRRVNGMGTGVILDERGYMLTNYHVVDGVSRIQVTLSDGQVHIARLVAGDPKTDLAVISVSAGRPLPVITTGTSSDLMLGEPVVAVGNAYGYENTVTRGIISSLHRSVEVSETQKYDDLIQTDASINPGNSGGPLLNVDGEMIGINAAVRVGAQGIGFAIPVDKAMAVAARLLTASRVDNLWHGVEGKTTITGCQGRFLVQSVAEGSPADKGGMRVGDTIHSVGDMKIERALDFERALIGRKAGEEVPVSVERGNRTRSLSLVMAPRPRRANSLAENAWNVLGLRLEPIPATEFRRLKSRYRGGLKVVTVRADSPAARQGIRSGDALVGMHLWETVSMDNVAYVLKYANSERLKFYVLRGNETLFGYLPVAMRKR